MTTRTTLKGISLVLVAVTIGCAGRSGPTISTAQLESELARVPVPLHNQYTRMRSEGRHNEVLNQERLGLSALEIGETKVAASAFESALEGIETVYADNENAKRARSIWHAEGAKDFKGEPYERSMAYMYRGLLYLGAGDFQNARASFKGGQLQDQLAEDEVFRGDFASLDMLAGFASQCDGDRTLANDFYTSAERERPGLVRPGANDNLLIVAETGSAPVKYATGKYKEELRINRGSGFKDQGVQVRVDGHDARPATVEDIYFQASTRGSRPIDKILAGHASFKEGNQASGRMLSEVGLRTANMALQMSNTGLAGAGVAIALFGVGQQLVAAAMTAEADTRAWESLPDKVHFATAHVALGAQAQVEAAFLDTTGSPIVGGTRSERVSIGNGSCGIVWLRSGSAANSLSHGPVGVAASATR